MLCQYAYGFDGVLTGSQDTALRILGMLPFSTMITNRQHTKAYPGKRDGFFSFSLFFSLYLVTGASIALFLTKIMLKGHVAIKIV